MDRHKKEDNGNNTLHLQVNVGSKMIKASRPKQGVEQQIKEVSHEKEINNFGGVGNYESRIICGMRKQ